MLGRSWRRLRYIAKSGLRRRFRDLVIGPLADDMFVVREDLARRYLAGEGIEIGALTWPLRMPPRARVRYVDYLSREALMREHRACFTAAERDPASIPEIDVVDDAERLAKFADGSVDFVVANHVLEHLEDTVGALQNFLRVTRPGGVVFLTLPDARHSFDAPRPRTTVEHLLRDHREGPVVSRTAHYEEWARFYDGMPEERVAARVAELTREAPHHHFHVWELEGFLALLGAVALPATLELAQANRDEFVVILRRT